jgi:hypothetical protein
MLKFLNTRFYRSKILLKSWKIMRWDAWRAARSRRKRRCARAAHCYRPEMRQRVREVMRFAGPKMLLRHPLLAVRHLLDERRKPPPLKRRSG